MRGILERLAKSIPCKEAVDRAERELKALMPVKKTPCLEEGEDLDLPTVETTTMFNTGFNACLREIYEKKFWGEDECGRLW